MTVLVEIGEGESISNSRE